MVGLIREAHWRMLRSHRWRQFSFNTDAVRTASFGSDISGRKSNCNELEDENFIV